MGRVVEGGIRVLVKPGLKDCLVPNFGKSGLQLEIHFRGEYQSFVTLAESNHDSNN